MLLFSIPVVIVSALPAIVIIIKNKKLQTNNNLFLVNLLLSDVGLAVVLWCTEGLLTDLYLLDVSVDVDCRITVILIMTFIIANQLMFIPMCVNWFIHIAFLFSYKHIVTTKTIMTTIITLWMVAIAISPSIYINDFFDYISSMGMCQWKQTNIPQLLIFIHTHCADYHNKYILALQDHQVKHFFPQCQEKCCPTRKSHKAGRLSEIPEEQVKSTLAVFRVGGIDAVLDILLAFAAVVSNFFSPSSTMAFIVNAQFVAIPIQYLQSANHALVYNIDIREKIIGCIRMRNKSSKVIVLQRE